MRTPSARYSAGALAVLCLLGPILGYAHMLLVRHAQCPEHGELVHLDEAGVTDDHPGGDDGEPSDAGTLALPPAPESDPHGHDHCAAVPTRKTEVPLSSAGAALAAAEPLTSPRPSADAVVSAPIALYVLAPKNSPPA